MKSPLGSEMWNSFLDKTYGIEFIVCHARFLKDHVAQKFAKRVIQEQKNNLFLMWKLRPENWNWKGGIATKKESLFQEHLQKLNVPLSWSFWGDSVLRYI